MRSLSQLALKPKHANVDAIGDGRLINGKFAKFDVQVFFKLPEETETNALVKQYYVTTTLADQVKRERTAVMRFYFRVTCDETASCFYSCRCCGDWSMRIERARKTTRSWFDFVDFLFIIFSIQLNFTFSGVLYDGTTYTICCTSANRDSSLIIYFYVQG